MRPTPSMTRKLFSASGIALATAIAAHAPIARAQSFNGSVAATFGSVTVGTGTGTTTVTVSSPSAVINWTPNDVAATGAPIDFQSAGTTATFSNNPSGTSDFVVLNRIVPSGSTRPIQFNGSVISQLQGANGPTPGGSVFFYSPGGILVGSSAVFDVGNLVLTASDLAFTGTGTFNSGASYVFQQASVPGAQISVLPGAQITASVDGSYIAMIAPGVVNGGKVSVNGSAALVAADAATIRFAANGLFDIAVNSGTSATGTVLANNGTITGPSGAVVPGINHRIYMVAVPKNDAITMAIASGSNLGFDIAGAANQDADRIVLSAGHDVTTGFSAVAPSAGGGTGLASIDVTDANITSALFSTATGGFNMGSISSTGLRLAGNFVSQAAGASSSLYADTGGSVTAANSVSIRSDISRSLPLATAIPGANVTAMDVVVRASGSGTIAISGGLTLSAQAVGGQATTTGSTGGFGNGGTLRVEATDGGTISVAGQATFFAMGTGGGVVPSSTVANGGAGAGGLARILATGTAGSSVSVGDAVFNVDGTGGTGRGCVTCVPASGTGTGGIVNIRAIGQNTVNIGGTTQITANGTSGIALAGASAQGTGGVIDINSSAGASLGMGIITANANGLSGNGFSASGGAEGGSVSLSATGAGGGNLTFSNNVTLTANGSSGLVSGLTNPAGLSKGGQVYVGASDGTTLEIGNGLSVNASGTSGSTSSGSAFGTGGTATLDAANGGTVRVLSGATLQASGSSGTNIASGGASAGTGGLAQVTLSTNGVVTVGTSLTIVAGGGGYDGTGGTARIFGRSSGNLAVTGATTLSANGSGGAGSSSLFQVGNGFGGSALIDLGGAQASFGAALTLNAFGTGGVGTTVGGSGTGGNASINLLDSTLNATGAVYLGAVGSGANTAPTGGGGRGQGGNARVNLTNSSSNLLNTLTLDATGNGGSGTGALSSAATGTGGLAAVSVSAGTLAVSSTLRLLADGAGGRGVVQGDGGLGTGGTINLIANGDARGDSVITAPTYLLRANGLGGQGAGASASGSSSGAPGSAGGNAQGGSVYISAAADGGTISGGTLDVNAIGFGGLGGNGFGNISTGGRGGNGGIGGSAHGGAITLDSVKGTGTGSGAMTFGSIVTEASGTGGPGGSGGSGATRGDGGNGGSGTGGTVNITLDRGGSNISTGSLRAFAVGSGGNGGDCDLGCPASGGNATGGSLFVGSNGATTGNTLTATSEIFLTAGAYGGSTVGNSGGTATAGNSALRLNSGLALQAGTLSLDSIAQGGDSVGSGPAGSAQSGVVQFVASGTGTANIANDVFISSVGRGGNGYGAVTVAGTGTGGLALIYSDGGAISINGAATVDSGGFGGLGNQNTPSGAGGDGIGGESSFRVGGNSQLGNGGSITVAGITYVLSEGTGGDGFAAGAGTGGVADIYTRQGAISLGQVNAFASGSGGFGTLGGSGGAGTGGGVGIQTANAVQGPSQISFTQAIADASAFGGFGSDGTVAGAAGGLGGAAQGGSVVVAGTAGNGTLQAGTVIAFADATGGDGGFASGASGGNGGLGSAGSVQIGTISSSDTGTVNAGSATYGSVLASASAFGGAGGDTDTVNPNATGGNGGAASGGGASLLVRGSPVTITGVASLLANATGGAGGSGPITGLGGNASIGSSDPLQVAGAYALVTNRFNQPAQRGTLTATDLQFTSIATGGGGATAGTSTNFGGAVGLEAINSDIAATNMAFVSQAATLAAGGTPEAISLTGSSATISNGFSLNTSTNVSLTLAQSNLTGGQVVISGNNWVLDPVVPAVLGDILGTTSLSLSSGLDLVAYANVRSLGSLSLIALGKIDLGALLAAGFIDVTAGSSLTLDDVTSSGDSIDLTSAGAISTGNLTAATAITVDTAGAVTAGNIVAGTGAPSAAGLGIVAISSGGSVTTGSISANSDLGISAVAAITTGQATAYDMLLLGGGNISTSGLSATNRVMIADVSLAALGQTASGFDKELVFAANPVTSTAGSIALGGPVSATAFRAATQATFTSGAISVMPSSTGSGLLRIDAGGAIVATNLLAAKDVALKSATSIQTGNVTSQTGSATFTAPSITLGAIQVATAVSLTGQTITTTDLTAASSIMLTASGSLSTGNLVAGTGAPSASGLGAVGISAGGNVSTGTITASSDLGISAVGTIATGQAAAYDMLLLGGGNIATGGLTAANRVLIADVSQGAIGQTATGFDKELVFAANPVTSTAGSIALGGPVSATAFRAATQATFTSAGISVPASSNGSGLLRIDASGAIVSGNLFAANDLIVSSLASIQSGTVVSQSGGTTLSAPTINVGAMQAAGNIAVSGQTITTGNLLALGQGASVIGRATQAITTGGISAQGAISIIGTSRADVQAAISSNGFIEVAAGDVLNIGTVNSARSISLIAGATNAAGGLVAGQGSIAAGTVTGAGLVQIAAGGQVGTTNVRSTGDSVKIASFGSTVTTGAVTAARDVLVSGAQGVTIGASINARDVILLSGANVTAAGIFAGAVFAQSPTSPSGFALTNATGRVLVANSSMANGALLLSTASDFTSLFVAPVSLSGSVNLIAQVVAGQFLSYSQGNMTGAAIAAFNSIEVESGGLVTVGQRWGSPNIEIISADIQIIDNGTLSGPNGQILSGLRTSATGEIDLISISGSPALIGDGLSGNGYSLSAAEIGLISANLLVIGAVDVATNPVDMLIGNLALTAGGTNNSTTLGGSAGSVRFVTGNRQTQVPGGAIRVVGNVSGNGFAGSNIVEFNTGRFEIDAGTGSVALMQSGTTLGGTVEIHATNIHVASASILDKLVADPFYVGRVAELNAPAAVPRTDGVLRALGLDLYPTGTLYIQNTGTALDPAGFFADIDLTTLNTAPNAAPASISIIVNGKWQTPTGVVSGFAARDLVVSTSDVLSFFAPESTINGCAINASSCAPAVAEIPVDPVPAIASQIQIISNDALGSTPTFTAEPESSASPAAAEQLDEPAEEAQTPEEAASEADDAASPIAPPPQIIDSSPLEPQQQVEQPVAGSGNPSLIGSVVNEASAEGEAQ